MPTYSVTQTRITRYEITTMVEAESPEQAKRKAVQLGNWDQDGFGEVLCDVMLGAEEL